MRPLPLLLFSLSLFAEEKLTGVIIHETGQEPLAQGLAFHHGSWKFADGAMLGEQVPTEKHTATIKILTVFDQIKAEWKMKFLDPKENFLFVSWPADSGAHAMDFTFLPDSGKFELIRPAFKHLKRAANATAPASAIALFLQATEVALTNVTAKKSNSSPPFSTKLAIISNDHFYLFKPSQFHVLVKTPNSA